MGFSGSVDIVVGVAISRPPTTKTFRASINIRRAEDCEKIIRQIKQNSVLVVNPTRRDFVKYDGKDSAEISCDEFLEMSFMLLRFVGG